MSTTEIHYNISGQTCRVCLETPQANDDEASLCLQDEIEYNDLKVELWQLLEAVSKVKYTWYDSIFPTQMCQNCTRRLIVAYEFMREVEKSQQILQELYELEKLREQSESQEAHKVDVVQMLEIDDNIIGDAIIESDKVVKSEENKNVDDYELELSQAVKKEEEEHLGIGIDDHTQFLKSESLEGQTTNACNRCPRTFKRHDGLRRHIRASHPGECAETSYGQDSSNDLCNRKQRECLYCGISFPITNLSHHIRSHLADKSYKCNQCDKAYLRNQELSLHRRQHKGQRLSECTICSKRFISKNRLYHHMHLHAGQSLYDSKLMGQHQQQTEMQDTSKVVDVPGNHFRADNVNQIGHKCESPDKPHPYKCGICGMIFKSGALLTVHRNNLSHYNNNDVNYGDPFGGADKKKKQEVKNNTS